jgi:pimeloyl-ACP methyl ester carboxylesterase
VLSRDTSGRGASLNEPRYTDRGSGPAVVLSHGTLMDRTMFDAQIAALQDRYRVVAFDHRARTDRWRGAYSLDELADDCVALLDELGIERCVLGGMSMGGFMAIPLALRHPERLDGLVLISSMAAAYSTAERAEIEEKLSELLPHETVTESFAEWERDLVIGATTQRESPQLVRHWMDRWKTRRAEAVAAEFRSWTHKPDMTPRLGEIELPALVIHGTEDAVLPIERGRALAAALPNARFVAIERAGHTTTVEAPDAVSAAMREFLDELYGGRG